MACGMYGLCDVRRSFCVSEHDTEYGVVLDHMLAYEQVMHGDLSRCHLTKHDVEVPASYKDVMESKQKAEWLRGIEDEMRSHRENGTWELVTDSGQRCTPTKFVYKAKIDKHGRIVRWKVRLVAQAGV